MQLSYRLESITEYLEKCHCLADIGTDHALVPVMCIRRQIAEKVIASDLRKGPLTTARSQIKKLGLDHVIECRLGDGLSVLQNDEADEILIAGMGGELTADILINGQDKLGNTEHLVLSPHTKADKVREAVETVGFHLIDETMIVDKGKYYVILKAVPGRTAPMSEEERIFGPVLLKQRPAVFQAYLRKECEKTVNLIEKLHGKEETGSTIKALKTAENYLNTLKSL